jgi:copper oxidase (laccase) domain-containing protein
VLEATVAAMRALGARDLRAAIGPSISQAAYEVGPEMMDEVLADDAQAARFFAGGAGDRMQFDLPGYGLARLRAAGVEAEWTRHCTYRDPARFYSYRRATHRGEADYGRLISAIRL